MIYNVDINSDNKTLRLCNNFYSSAGFTLTVKAANDAPIVLHPMEESYLSWDATMVLNPI